MWFQGTHTTLQLTKEVVGAPKHTSLPEKEEARRTSVGREIFTEEWQLGQSLRMGGPLRRGERVHCREGATGPSAILTWASECWRSDRGEPDRRAPALLGIMV